MDATLRTRSVNASSLRLPWYRASYLQRYHPYARHTPSLFTILQNSPDQEVNIPDVHSSHREVIIFEEENPIRHFHLLMVDFEFLITRNGQNAGIVDEKGIVEENPASL